MPDTLPETIRLTLKVDASSKGGPPAATRVRMALKVLLRRFGLRCISIEAADVQTTAATADAAAGVLAPGNGIREETGT